MAKLEKAFKRRRSGSAAMWLAERPVWTVLPNRPTALNKLMEEGGTEKIEHMFSSMLKMKNLNIEALEEALV